MNEHRRKPIISLERAAIRVRDRRVLTEVSWNIYPAQHWAVIGPNGAGKTSLAGALRGVAPVVAGRIDYAPGLSPAQDIGYISFEKHRGEIAREEAADDARYFSDSVLDQTTARQLIADSFALAARGAPIMKRRELIEAAGLWDLLDRPIRALSMGEMRKLLLIREVLARPRILVLDEPFDGLDPASRKHMGQVFEKLMQDGIQLILITHHLDEIPAFITHLLGIREGRILFGGPRARMEHSGQINKLYTRQYPESEENGELPLAASASESAAAGPLVQMKNTTVRYGSMRVFEQLDWTLCDGENWAVMGPNGCGKTTLLRMIAADHPQAYSNEIFVFGRLRGSGESIWDIKKNIGWISTEFQIRYRKSVKTEDVVMSGFFDSVGLYRQGSGEQRATAQRWMNLVGISDKAQRPFTQLSHGAQRLVLIARSMVKSPLLLILDEPCQGLDPRMRARVLHLVDMIGFQTRTNILYVTHHPDEWLACLTHILRFETTDSGVRIFQGPVPGSRLAGSSLR